VYLMLTTKPLARSLEMSIETKIVYLKRKSSNIWQIIVGFNLVVPSIIVYSVVRSGVPAGLAVHRLLSVGLNGLVFFATIAIIANIIPFICIYKFFSYRVGYDGEAIYVRPFPRSGAYMRIRFDEIERVDLASWLDIYQSGYGRQKIKDIANIRIHRRNTNGDKKFLIVSNKLCGNQLKDFVRVIYENCPESFSKNMLRYLNSDKIYPPYVYALDEINGRPAYRW